MHNLLKIPFLNNTPFVSISQLEKSYLKNQKKKHQYSSSTVLPKFIHQDIKIKSPFYRKICQKVNCKCQFHKKQKIPVPKFISGIKRDFNNFNLKNNQRQSKSQQQEKNKRFSSSFNKFSGLLNQNNDSSKFQKQKRYKTLAQDNQYQGIDLEDAKKQYQKYLKEQNIKNKNKDSLDCHNIQFEQFLKSRYLCILEKCNKSSKSKKDLYKRNRLMLKKNYLSTEYNNDSDREDDSMNMNMSKKADYGYLAQKNNLTHLRRLSKLNFGNQQSLLINTNNCISKQQEITNILNKLKDEYFGHNVQISQDKLLALICKNLMAGDQILKQQTKKFIKRLSQVPLGLFKSLFSDMKQEIKSGINIDLDTIHKSQKDVQNAVKLVITQVQKNVEELVKQKKQKKGNEKIQILNKMRKEINSGFLLNPLSSGVKQKTRRSKIFINQNQFKNWDDIELSEHTHKDQKENEIDQLGDENIQTAPQSHFYGLKDKSNSTQVRKGANNKKKTNGKTIIMQIQNQIQKKNQLRKPLQAKTFALPQEIAYQKRRAQSRRRLRQQEARNHRQFIQIMRQKQLQRQSSTLSQYQAQKNTIKSHFQRNKIFLKKMQMVLQNSQLRDVVINLQDDVLTKKRKMRLLQNMIEVQDIKGTQFYHDMRKYIEIYQKNCMLATRQNKNQKTNSSNRFTKRMLLSRQKYFQYQIPQIEQKKSKQEIQLMQLLKFDQQLKFYLIHSIKCEGIEDPDNYTIKIPQSISHKQAPRKRNRNIWYKIWQDQDCNDEPQSDSQILGQAGLSNKFPQQKIPIINTFKQIRQKSQNLKRLKKQQKIISIQKNSSKLKPDNNILKLQSRFQKKMKEYRRIFKTCGNQV